MRNSRLKDYFDIWLLTNAFVFDYDLLNEAIQKTFERRENELPVNIPVGLTAEFFQDAIKQSQWNAFLKKVSPSRKPANLQTAVERITDFLKPFIFTPSTSFIRWLPDKGWQ